LAHLLIIDLPGDPVSDLLRAALARGDRYTFLTADLAPYRSQPALQALLDRARHRVEVPGLAAAAVAQRVLALHAVQPFDAVLCGPGAHHADIALLAQRLHCAFLNPVTAALLCEPLLWQQRLQLRGLPQHGLVGSAGACGALCDAGSGSVIACDTLTQAGRHRLLGVHEPLWQAGPSTALRGSTFTPHSGSPRAGPDTIERYLGAVLDALDVDHGATHTELVITARGLQVARITAGVPGGRRAQLVGYALGRSLQADLIALHCGQALPVGSGASPQVAVLRTIEASRHGLLDEVVLPTWQDPAIRCVDIARQPGQAVGPPLSDADSLGCVMVCGPSRADAEDLADHYVARAWVRLRPASAADGAAPGLESPNPDAAPARPLAPTPVTVQPWPQNPASSPPLPPEPNRALAGCSKAVH